MKRVYLDYAAATPLDPRVLKKMAPFFGATYGNPSSIHKEGRDAAQALAKARSKIAQILSVRPDEIIFTGSGTESAALALCGVVNAYPQSHLITSAVEHAAVLENAKMLGMRGHRVTMMNAKDDGIIDIVGLTAAITKDTVLISVMYVNNEVGSVEPLRDIMRIVRTERSRRRKGGEDVPLYVHTDACQAAEYMPLAVSRLGVDLMTLNASKVYGPKGVGMLYKRRGVLFVPLWQGGGQEYGMRSGTEYVSGIVGFAEALQIAEEKKKKEYARMAELQAYFLEEIRRTIPRAVLNGPPLGTLRVPHNIHVTIPGIAAETLVIYLDELGISASAGSACDTHGVPEDARRWDGIRFTMGRHTTRADIDYTLMALCDSIKILQ